ncbi:YgaP family membrane protein [Shewanella sp. A14]
MKCNIGKTDRIIRVILGVCVIAVGVYYQSWWGAVGIIPIFTAAIGWCPAYVPFGISSCKTEK